MRIIFTNNYFYIFFLGLICFRSSAQDRQPDSLLYSGTARHVIDYFNHAIAEGSEIYNGSRHELLPPANKGSFYFEDKNYCVPSLVCYNHRWYKDIPVIYDIRNDNMVSAKGDYLYVLDPQRASDVYLLGHHFVFFSMETENHDKLSAGYYDMMYDGKSRFLVKRTKFVNETDPSKIIYEDKTYFFIKKGKQYLPVNSEGSLMDIFKDKSKELKQYLKNNKIRFNTDKEYAVARLAAYYDQISN